MSARPLSRIRIGMTAPDSASNVSGFATKLDAMESLGLDTVELPFYSLDLLVGSRRDPVRCRRFLEACKDRPFGFTAHLPLSINFFAEEKDAAWHFDVFRASLDLAAEAGAENAVIHTGIMRAEQAKNSAAACARQREMLARAAPEAEARNCFICVENLFGTDIYQTASAGQLAVEIEAVGHPYVRATLDVSHAFLHCAQNNLEFPTQIARLAPYARHVHMHDSFGKPDNGMYFYNSSETVAFGAGDLHLCVGKGSIPWNEFLNVCNFPRDTIFNIELNDRYFDDEAEECVAATRALAAQGRSRV